MKKQPYHQPLLTRHKVPRAVAAKAASECALMLVCSDAAADDAQRKVTKEGTKLRQERHVYSQATPTHTKLRQERHVVPRHRANSSCRS
jgi:hypothetical protein